MSTVRDRLCVNPAVVLAPDETGYLAFDTETERLHTLNPGAALMVELCDGTRGLNAVREALLPVVGRSGWAECRQWLETARRSRLLVPAATGRRPAPSADDLSKQAARLLDDDQTVPAFVCQRRAAELAPEDPQTWYQLGEYAHIVGRRDEARRAYQRYFAVHPDDAEVEHLLAALGDESPPPRASDRCIEQLYQRFASFYDDNMSQELEYRAPSRLYEALTSVIDRRDHLEILDLGCGTGLGGLLLKRRARRLVGVDLSGAMIQRAHRRDIYDQLYTSEITQWLTLRRDRQFDEFDVIAACDTLIYFGDLRPVISLAAGCLRPDGVLVFTVERADTGPFQLTDSGRYAHHPRHVADVAAETGLMVRRLEETVIRYEYGEPVVGLVAVLAPAMPPPRTGDDTAPRGTP